MVVTGEEVIFKKKISDFHISPKIIKISSCVNVIITGSNQCNVVNGLIRQFPYLY